MKTISESAYNEDVLIASVLYTPDKAFHVVHPIIRPEYFTISAAKACWLAACKHYDNGSIDPGKVYQELTSDADKAWFMGVGDRTIPLGSAVKSVACSIARAAKLRRIEAGLLAVANSAKSPTADPDWILEDMLRIFRSEAGAADKDCSIAKIMSRFDAVQAKNMQAGSMGKRTGFEFFQKNFITYQPGHLWVIGAWTSVGKSAMMIEAVNRFHSEHLSGQVAIFSTEMTEEQNVARLLANKTGVNANVILSGKMLENHAVAVEAQKQVISGRNLHIYDKLRDVDDIMAQCRKLAHSGGVDVVWIDFIQNLTRPGAKSQYEMFGQIAKDLQALAHDLRCTVICLSQLPNQAGREDTGILEFKGAGEIAAACDVGVLMKRAKEDNTEILFDVRKNRHGKTAKFILQFVDGWTRIIEKEEIK